MSLQIGLSIVAQAVHKALAGVSATVTPIHSLDLTTAPSASNSFDDYGLATSRTVTDYNGRIVQIPADAVPMGGLRPVRNLCTAPQDLTDATWVGIAEDDATHITFTANWQTFRQNAATPKAGTYVVSFDLQRISGSDVVWFMSWNAAEGNYQTFATPPDETLRRYSFVCTHVASSINIGLAVPGIYTNPTQWLFTNIQIQDITHRADLSTAPDEYVSVGVGTGPELVTNGDGSDGVTGWSEARPGFSTITNVGGRLRSTGNSTTNHGIVQTLSGLTVGGVYIFRADYYDDPGQFNGCYVRVSATSDLQSDHVVDEVVNRDNTIATTFTATAATMYVGAVLSTTGAGDYFELDNVSVKHCDPGNTGADGFRYFDTALANTVTSNVVTEATGASIEGWLDYQPGATNLLTYSNDLSQASWFVTASGAGAVSPTKTAAYADGPLGENTANRMQLNRGTDAAGYSVTYKQATLSNATNYCGSVYLKSLSGTPTVCVYLTGNAYSGITGLQLVTLSADAWTRVDCTGLTTSANSANFTIGLLGSSYVPGASQTADILVSAAQLETGTVPTAYIPTTTGSAYRPAMSPAPTISGLVGTEDARLTVKGLAADLVTPDPTDTTERTLDVDNTDGEFDTLPSPIKVLSVDVYNDGERPA